MIKKTISYTNFNGDKVNEDFYFNLTTAELLEEELRTNNTFSQKLERISQSTSAREILPVFTEIIKLSYGERVIENGPFIKSEEIWQSFKASPAFDVLLFSLLSDVEEVVEFIKALVPNTEHLDKIKNANTERTDGRPATSDYQKKQEPNRNSFEHVEAVVPENAVQYPVEAEQSTEPVNAVPIQDQGVPVNTMPPIDLNSLSREQLLAHLNNQNGQSYLQ